jgi:hypothetical protein
MPSTLTPACSFCGLRFASRPLLELHIREDHSGRSPGGTAAPPSRTAKEAGAVPTTPRSPRARPARSPRARPARATRARPGRMTTAARRAIGALRYANQELVRASEAMARPGGTAAERGDKAA